MRGEACGQAHVGRLARALRCPAGSGAATGEACKAATGAATGEACKAATGAATGEACKARQQRAAPTGHGSCTWATRHSRHMQPCLRHAIVPHQKHRCQGGSSHRLHAQSPDAHEATAVATAAGQLQLLRPPALTPPASMNTCSMSSTATRPWLHRISSSQNLAVLAGGAVQMPPMQPRPASSS